MAYKTDKWYVSPWNDIPAVKDQVSFSPKIEIHDVTLRDGEQQTGIAFTKDDKIRIAEQLAEIGVTRIEAGMPLVTKDDELAIREIVKRKLGPKIYTFSRCMKVDLDLAADCGVDGVVIEIPSSEAFIKNSYHWSVEKAIETCVQNTQYAKELGLHTVFFPLDSSHAQLDWFLDYISKINADGHMDAITIVDSIGGVAPHAIPHVVREIKKRINKPVEAHFHNDFGMGVANTVMALAAGADVAHTSISGIGERSGNACFEEIVMSLLVLYGVDLGIKTEKMCELSQFIQHAGNLTLPHIRPIVGDWLYKIESGLVAGFYRKTPNKADIFPFHWNLTGNVGPEVVLGKHSGAESIDEWLERLARTSATGKPIEITKEKKMEILMAVKKKALAQKELLTFHDFEEILAEAGL